MSKFLTIEVPNEVYDAYKDMARNDDRSVRKYIKRVLTDWLKSEKIEYNPITGQYEPYTEEG